MSKSIRPHKETKGAKYAVKTYGEYVLDYSEYLRNEGLPCWFIGKGRVAGNTQPIPAGMHATPRQAWAAALKVLERRNV